MEGRGRLAGGHGRISDGTCDRGGGCNRAGAEPTVDGRHPAGPDRLDATATITLVPKV